MPFSFLQPKKQKYPYICVALQSGAAPFLQTIPSNGFSSCICTVDLTHPVWVLHPQHALGPCHQHTEAVPKRTQVWAQSSCFCCVGFCIVSHLIWGIPCLIYSAAINFRWPVSQTQTFFTLPTSVLINQTSPSCASSSCELTSHLFDDICFYLQSEKNESDEKQEGNSSGDKEPSSLKQRLAQKRKAEQGKHVLFHHGKWGEGQLAWLSASSQSAEWHPGLVCLGKNRWGRYDIKGSWLTAKLVTRSLFLFDI